jgi:class 3 adenylate cyclase
LQAELDGWRDDFDRKIDAARAEMRRLARAAIIGTQAYQRRVVDIGIALLAIAAGLGITVAPAVTIGLVRPVRRLLLGTASVESGALDTFVPITSRDEIGSLTRSFNSMVGELRVKQQIRETFGKYVDPRIVAGLIDIPELTETAGAPRNDDLVLRYAGVHRVQRRDDTLGAGQCAEPVHDLDLGPVRRNNRIIDKYLGDGIMAFWGPPFTGLDEHPGLACAAAIDQLANLDAFRAELVELIGFKRGLPKVDIRIGVATGDVVVGNIGSKQTRSYTAVGDTVNLASRLEGANRTYGTQVLVSGPPGASPPTALNSARSTGCWCSAKPSRNVSLNCSPARAKLRRSG